MADNHPQNPSRAMCLVLSALPLVVSIAVIALVALGYLWSLFFDLPGHKVIAWCSMPGLVTSFGYGCLIGYAFRKDRSCRRLTVAGLLATVMALAISISVLYCQTNG